MSYDIFLRGSPCVTCGHLAEPSNLPTPTYNLTPIFDLALTGATLPSPDVPERCVVLLGKETARSRWLRKLNGRKASETVEALKKALAMVNDPAYEEKFRALEPENGWGTLLGARYLFKALIDAAEEHPDLVWEIR
jgi:hypothetical protein